MKVKGNNIDIQGRVILSKPMKKESRESIEELENNERYKSLMNLLNNNK